MAVSAGLSYALGALVPLVVVIASPRDLRVGLTFIAVLLARALTGWLAAWVTGLPPLRLVRRNLLLGAATLGTAW